ncbi:MAG: hypothetical protein ABH845_06410, partial [Candidatus Omnitrophota bacterium]
MGRPRVFTQSPVAAPVGRSKMTETTQKITDIEVDIKEVEKKLEEMKIKDIEISAGRKFKPGGVMS